MAGLFKRSVEGDLHPFAYGGLALLRQCAITMRLSPRFSRHASVVIQKFAPVCYGHASEFLNQNHTRIIDFLVSFPITLASDHD